MAVLAAATTAIAATRTAAGPSRARLGFAAAPWACEHSGGKHTGEWALQVHLGVTNVAGERLDVRCEEGSAAVCAG